MKKLFFAAIFSLVASMASAGTNQFVMNDAKEAAVKFFRENPSYGLKPGNSVRLKSSDSQELTREYLTQQMSWIGSGNRFHGIYKAMIAEMDQNPSLQIFYITLGAGSGYDRTENNFIVKLRVVSGQLMVEVTEAQ